MDADAILLAGLERRGFQSLHQLTADEIVELALQHTIWISAETFARAPWLAPFAIRQIRIRTEPHAPGAKRDLWGLPMAEGYFTDDNPLIKPVFRGSQVSPRTSLYGQGKLTKGLACCQVSAGTTADPLLFSLLSVLRECQGLPSCGTPASSEASGLGPNQ